jgi:hypothetical protein
MRNQAVIRVHLCPSVAQSEFFRILPEDDVFARLEKR